MPRDPIERLTDPAGLRANREGRLGPMQTARLGEGAYRSRFERVAGFVGSVGAAVAAAWSARLGGEALLVGALAAVIVGLAAIVFRPWSDPLGRDVHEGSVSRVTGIPLSLAVAGRRVRGRWTAAYHVSIDGLQFRVPAWAWAAIDEARTVTAYYLPRSMTLVAIEAADGRDGAPVLPEALRRVPLRSDPGIAVAYFGAIGLGLLVRAVLPPVELLPEIPAAVLFLAIAAAIVARSRPASSATGR